MISARHPPLPLTLEPAGVVGNYSCSYGDNESQPPEINLQNNSRVIVFYNNLTTCSETDPEIFVKLEYKYHQQKSLSLCELLIIVGSRRTGSADPLLFKL